MKKSKKNDNQNKQPRNKRGEQNRREAQASLNALKKGLKAGDKTE